MAVEDITGVVWNIGGWNGSFFIINGDQLDPSTANLSANAIGVSANSVGATITITDPLGHQFQRGGLNGAADWGRFYIDLMGTYHFSVVFDDGVDTREFTHDIITITQYDSGGGIMRDIPLGASAQPKPPWEWLPATGYYNRGDGVCVAGTTPVPLNNKFHCDIITRQCRPFYLGSPLACPIVTAGKIATPNRKIPAVLLAHKQSRTQSTCWCWAIKPKTGDWEAFTSLNRDIDLPEYTDEMGNVVPALTYLSSSGIQPTAIPVRLTLAKNATDVTVLAFDREKLERQYYTGSEFEVFEINYRGDLSERWVAGAGKLGNTNVSDSTAQIELTPWADLANRPLGREVLPLCDVGVYNGEEFGTGRCRNQALHDGPDKDDWTVEFVSEVYPTTGDALTFRVLSRWVGAAEGFTAKSGATTVGGWHTHLREGKVLFTSGKNKGVERDIQTAYPNVLDTHESWYGINIRLHTPLPFVPEHTDTVEVTAGCRRTWQDCLYYNNTDNYRGFPNVPGKEGVIRRYEED